MSQIYSYFLLSKLEFRKIHIFYYFGRKKPIVKLKIKSTFVNTELQIFQNYKTMRKLKFIILLLLLGGIGYAAFYLIKRAPIFTGFAAKNVASDMFVAGRTLQSVKDVDINFFPVNLTSIEVDTVNKIVKTSFLGFGKQVAVYREGLGCTLLADADLEKVKAQQTKVEILPKNPSELFWPWGDKIRDTNIANINTTKLNKAMETALQQGHTRAIIVAYDTLVYFEKYNNGFNENTRILGWSMSKSITNALIGILVKQGKLELDAPAPIAEWTNDDRKNITLNQLMQMSSGLAWVEDYGDISDATKMLYMSSDFAKYAIESKLANKPGEVNYYSSGTSNILSEIIKRTINDHQAYLDFPRTALFNKIGMRSAIMETDAAGTFVGSSYTYATPRDWARFGLLFLNNGYWRGEQILPSGWVDYSRTSAKASSGDYGAQFWLNYKKVDLPNCPEDIYFADGYKGQRVYVIPSKKLVIVRMGQSKTGEFDYDKFVKSIIESIN